MTGLVPDFATLRRTRAHQPQAVLEILAQRSRRPLWRNDNRLLILAADHPGRGALGVGDDAMVMGDRYALLTKLYAAMCHPGVDGFLGTPDLIDDLALLGALDDKIVIGSLNRGGLRSATFEMDDRFTAYNVDTLCEAGLDFAKLLLRINLNDAGSVATLEAASRSITRAAELQLPIIIEPFMCVSAGGVVSNDLSTDAVVRSVAIASALGASSIYSWLKLPVVPEMDRVMKATTLPTLLLGGDSATDAEAVYASWEAALALPGVHGLVVGRNLLFPQDGNVAAAIERAARLVHG